jgi:hypothetical protein
MAFTPLWRAINADGGPGRETATLLRKFLGRPVSPDALIADIRRIGD